MVTPGVLCPSPTPNSLMHFSSSKLNNTLLSFNVPSNFELICSFYVDQKVSQAERLPSTS